MPRRRRRQARIQLPGENVLGEGEFYFPGDVSYLDVNPSNLVLGEGGIGLLNERLTIGPPSVQVENAIVWMVGDEVVGSMDAEYDLRRVPEELHALAMEAAQRRQIIHVGAVAHRLFPDRYDAPLPPPEGAPCQDTPDATEPPQDSQEGLEC